MFLSVQFTQSALDCMSVEVGRLRAFLQVRAHLDLRSSSYPFPSPPPVLMAAFLLPSRVGRRQQTLLFFCETWKHPVVTSVSSARRSDGECQGRMLLGSQQRWPSAHRFRAEQKQEGPSTLRSGSGQGVELGSQEV